MHYAVPCILHRAGTLARLFTDLDSRSASLRWLRLIPEGAMPPSLRRFLARDPGDVPREKTTAFNALGVRYAWQRASASSRSELTRIFLHTNRAFCLRVCRADWESAQAVYTCNAAGLEILQRARERQLRTVSEQASAPAAVERRLRSEECSLHPGWECCAEDVSTEAFTQREGDEWSLADLIVCGSEFVREGIRHAGVPLNVV